MHLIPKRILALCRVLHVYLTMFGLLVMLLFGITGFTLNHEDWFGATIPRVTDSQGQIPPELISRGDALRIVENLRTTFHISGAMADYDESGDLLSIAFKEPGQSWEVEIVKPSGKTTVHAEAYNLVAVVNNLHRGRYAGSIWRWVIDIAAVFIVVACGTGTVLWLALPRRRTLGIIALMMGIVGTLSIIHLFVPGADSSKRKAGSPALMAPAGRSRDP